MPVVARSYVPSLLKKMLNQCRDPTLFSVFVRRHQERYRVEIKQGLQNLLNPNLNPNHPVDSSENLPSNSQSELTEARMADAINECIAPIARLQIRNPSFCSSGMFSRSSRNFPDYLSRLNPGNSHKSAVCHLRLICVREANENPSRTCK